MSNRFITPLSTQAQTPRVIVSPSISRLPWPSNIYLVRPYQAMHPRLMIERRCIPTPLRIVAVLFLLYGICCLIGTVVSLLSNSIHIDPGILGIPTYFGLRRFSVGWRTFAIVCIWLNLIGTSLIILYSFFGNVTPIVRIFGVRPAELSPFWVYVVSIPFIILNVRLYRVLTHPQIRALFFGARNKPNAA